MLFNSLTFLIFFPIVIVLYFALPHRWRWMLLLGASYYFYMSWRPEYALLLLTSTLIDYYAALQMDKCARQSQKRKFLALSLIGNLGLLIAFKYFNFMSENFNLLFTAVNIHYHFPELKVLLPVGISFYTFQTIGYSIDVYRGKTTAEKHFGIFALYVSFFPQLVAGPIERSVNLLPQFRVNQEFSYDKMTSGLKLMLWGFFKKVVVADRLDFFVTEVFNDPVKFHGLPIILASMIFPFQLYCDFSGYSDIAIGSARTMGYKLMKNFDRPYMARSFSELWNRWHISLSSWLRDYLYITLGGNRKGKIRQYFNVIVTMLLGGLWHGASWNFIGWGALMAFYLALESATKNLRHKWTHRIKLDRLPLVHKYFDIILMNILVGFNALFFRVNTSADIPVMIKNALHFGGLNRIYAQLQELQFLSYLILLFALLTFEKIHDRYNINRLISRQHISLRWTFYLLAIISILFFGIFNQEQFIYFQF